MYKVDVIPLPKDRKMGDYIREIYLENDIETAKDLIFRLTFPYALGELKKLNNMTSVEDGLGDLSVAFTKTFNKYDPHNEKSSFMNYYKIVIKTEVVNTKYRNYRASKEKMNMCTYIESTMDSLDIALTNRDSNKSDIRTKGDVIPSDVDLDDEVYFLLMRERFIDIVRQVVRENPRRKMTHEPVMVYYAETLLDGEPTNNVMIGKVFNLQSHLVRRIRERYEDTIKELWKLELNL